MLKPHYTGCIYLATNRVNGRAYVGKTVLSLCDRRTVHIHAARRKASKSAFHSAIRKYGADAFDWSKLFECDNETELFDAERELIEDYRAVVKLYNLSAGGEGQSIPCTPERRAKLKTAMTGRTQSEAHRRNTGLSQRGKRKSTSHIENMRRAKKGKTIAPWSAERRAKHEATIAERKAAGLTSHSDETRRRQSEAALRRFASPEARLSMREVGKAGAKARWG